MREILKGLALEVVGLRHLPHTWPLCVPWLEAGSRGADYDVEDLRRMVFNDGRYLVVARGPHDRLTGAAVVEVQQTPKAIVAHVMAMGGRGVCTPEAARTLASACKVWFRADAVRCWAQPAQARLYKRCGMKSKAEVLEMECV